MNETKQEMNKIQEIKKVNKDSFKKDLIFLLLKIGGADNFLDLLIKLNSSFVCTH